MTVRRMKTYTAETGGVYQYYFVGKRDALPDAPEAPATEYIFDVTPDRRVTYAVSIFLQTDALDAWARAHERRLTDAEQYAAAKIRLFRAFDEIENMASSGRRLLLTPENIEDVLAVLGLE
jgi:hypothetical protein